MRMAKPSSEILVFVVSRLALSSCGLLATTSYAGSNAESAQTQREHWAYQRVERPSTPDVAHTWQRNPIDNFVLPRLRREGLAPAPAADRAALLRRVSLDLIGLPPTPPQIDSFLRDDHPDAYQRVIDRLLASPEYGEHWARRWLDLARFADTNGYNIDVPRSIWPYRDWVIEALNSNMPFDQFTIEQLAGDLLPDATDQQKIATGFHRNTMINQEGGVDPEEDRVKIVVDRVNTTSTVWLGSTLECAHCHTHKYDPFSQREYFQLYAFFNNSRDGGAGGPGGLQEPILRLFTPRQEERLAQIRASSADLEEQLKSRTERPEKQEPVKQGPVAREVTTEANDATEQATGKDPAQELKTRLDALRQQEKEVLDSVKATLVMAERTEARTTQLHKRGDFLDPGEEVLAAVPAALNPLPPDAPANRLGLAAWLVDRQNPLTSRVTVNRYWQRFFGVGMVSTSNDFGTQGEPPSHPKLLDWLAVEFMESGWNVKAIHKRIVTSATYRQSSHVSPELFDRDPDNRLCARGPRFRMEAEMIRDNALLLSGLLNTKIGGASVYPPQPAGFWLEFGTTGFGMEKWPASTGADKYRRGLYTFLRRTTTYPSLTIFDAPNREVCSFRRSRSNTALQALTTLNDPVFVECAVALAQRILQEGGADAAERVAYAFRLCVSRPPHPRELSRLVALYHEQHANFLRNRAAAEALIDQGADNQPACDDPVELAAWSVVASVLLNLDATITKS